MIAIIDYAAGNLTSVKRALDFLEIPCEISADPAVIRRADRIIFPGVGHAAAAMQVLIERKLDIVLKDAVAAGTPVLGICLGTQIILSRSEEGPTKMLGIIDGTVPRFKLNDPSLKVPHMGWDSVTLTRQHPVLRSVKPGDEFYFVHSYYPLPTDSSAVIATCDYGIEFPAVIGVGNLVATQFHPEKSGPAGLSILNNFAGWDGKPC
ncbi:MAG: imidazole glycerol phosphate synthase subunit HisH [Chitinispirillaceae bacterium]|jgi:glutamine amidotransferase|nr:imidazole glycerol phosphate synthase subunit HisH [Chitinispirillaceae bacterium]